MTAILRTRAAVTSSSIGEATLRGGGSGRGAVSFGPTKRVRRKWRQPEDPAAELMPAAEFLGHDPDFQAILEDFRDSPFDPRRRRVLGRLMGVFAMDYQGARSEERRFLRRLLEAGNAREGYAANRALHLCNASPIIRRTLALGVAESRFATQPTWGFLGAVQARVAATTFRLLGPRGRERIWDLLTRAGSDTAGKPVPAADRVIERALILKALAARRHRLGPWSADGPAALREIEAFAGQIRARPLSVLAIRTTLRAVDPDRAAPALTTLAAPARAAYLAHGDVDPVFAWGEHSADVEGAFDAVPPPAADIAGEVGIGALPELDRSALLQRPRLHQAFAEARAFNDGRLDEPERRAVSEYLVGRELSSRRSEDKVRGLARLQERGFDVASAPTIEAIREDARGIYKFDAAAALGLLLSRYTGAVYVRRVFSDQMTAGTDPVRQIITALGVGLTVPVVVKELRRNNLAAWAVLDAGETQGQRTLLLRQPDEETEVTLLAVRLVAALLPEEFGRRARADFYLAPAALDLLAPPFGIAFPAIGIEDTL